MSCCTGCAELTAEISSQMAFMLHWFKTLHEQIHSMGVKFEDANQQSIEFRTEIFNKIDGLRSDVLMNVEKFGWDENAAFEIHDPVPLVDILEKENHSEFGLEASQTPQSTSPQPANETLNVESVSDGFTLDSSPNNNKMSCSEAHFSGVSKPDSWLLPPTCREQNASTVVSVSTAVSALRLDNLSGVFKPDSMLLLPTCPQVVDNESIQNGSSTSSALASASTFSLAKLELLDEEINEEQVSLPSFAPATEFSLSNETWFEQLVKDMAKRSSLPRKAKKNMVKRVKTKQINKLQRQKSVRILKKTIKKTIPPAQTKKLTSRYFCDSRRVVCCLCGSSIRYLRLQKLQQHAVRHLDERAFQCSECNRKSIRRRDAVDHVKRLHPETKNPEDLILWAVDKEDFMKKLASITAKCFPNKGSSC